MQGRPTRWQLPLLRALVALVVALVAVPAQATVDPKCTGLTIPGDYDEQAHQDFLSNYFALSTTLSPAHGPIPHEPGHGAIGVHIGIIPPLNCDRRFVLNYTKTEETNKAPAVPRLQATFAFPALGKAVPYAGLAYLPPVKLLGMTNVFLSGEVGIGVPLGDVFQLGGRFHATTMKTVGEIASPFVDGDPVFDDLYLASTFGLDLMAGLDTGIVKPYVAIGWLDASTFFFIGDDSVVTNNYHPYFGPTGSIGVDGLVAERFRFGAELYAAPGGYSLPDKTVDSVKPAGRYGHIYTGRLRLAVEL
ncbi:MAG: hypothetical protein R3F59_37790 [Myxococcota bacterium]